MSGLRPGERVLARYANGKFYHAHIVRIYNKNGCALADVEWLRPRADSSCDRHHLCSTGLDETMHRDGLPVEVDLCRLTTSDADAFHDKSTCTTQKPPTPAPSAVCSLVLPDLLDVHGVPDAKVPDYLGDAMWTPTIRNKPSSFVDGEVKNLKQPFHDAHRRKGGSTGPPMIGPSHDNLRAPSTSLLTPSFKIGSGHRNMTSEASCEQFAFVSDMISEATRAAASTST